MTMIEYAHNQHTFEAAWIESDQLQRAEMVDRDEAMRMIEERGSGSVISWRVEASQQSGDQPDWVRQGLTLQVFEQGTWRQVCINS
jgi:hypothetical protein